MHRVLQGNCKVIAVGTLDPASGPINFPPSTQRLPFALVQLAPPAIGGTGRLTAERVHHTLASATAKDIHVVIVAVVVDVIVVCGVDVVVVCGVHIAPHIAAAAPASIVMVAAMQ